MSSNLPTSADAIQSKMHYPLLVALGSPREVSELLKRFSVGAVACYQMDLYQAQDLRERLAIIGSNAQVNVAPDLWDLSAQYRTIVYPAPLGGERALKIDIADQAFHQLLRGGTLIVFSPFQKDSLFSALLKKIYGKVHATRVQDGTVFWCHRSGDRPKRRHEIIFHAAIGGRPSCAFLSRPGVFSYGAMDDGARALLETTKVMGGDQILDLGCGCGTNGVLAGIAAGEGGRVVFVDSNVRAVALSEHNARANGILSFQAIASADLAVLPDESFDLVLANPPYYAQGAVARRFIDRAHQVLKGGGRFSLVTKQLDQVYAMVQERFAEPQILSRRGYAVLLAVKK
jgi:16S rRNA (guanine1207-N2)-methyltransferase